MQSVCETVQTNKRGAGFYEYNEPHGTLNIVMQCALHYVVLQIVIRTDVAPKRGTYNAPTVNEVAALIPDSQVGQEAMHRQIVLHLRDGCESLLFAKYHLHGTFDTIVTVCFSAAIRQ